VTKYLDPTLLGITPPMDLGRQDILTPAPPTMRISPFPLKLRGYTGQFGISRHQGEAQYVRSHEGVDLLAPIGTPVFAVQDGKVINASVDADSEFSTITIEHTKGFRYTTFYSEVHNLGLIERDSGGVVVRDAAGAPRIMNNGEAIIGCTVEQGDRIAEIRDFDSTTDPSEDQLHFEIRYPFSQTGSRKSETFAVDPTWALYACEKHGYTGGRTARHILSATRILEINEMLFHRVLRFLSIRVTDFDRIIYVPLGHLEDADKSLIETLRWAFFHDRQVDLAWRESLFFNQIEFGFTSNDKIAILVEIKVAG